MQVHLGCMTGKNIKVAPRPPETQWSSPVDRTGPSPVGLGLVREFDDGGRDHPTFAGSPKNKITPRPWRHICRSQRIWLGPQKALVLSVGVEK